METVNHSDLLVTFWDGEPSRGRGGTAEIVAYARELGRRLIIVDARTLAVRRENMERLKVGSRHMAGLNQLPGVPVPSSPPVDPGHDRVRGFHLKVDHAATHGAPHFRRLITVTFGLHVLATGLAAATLAFYLHHPAMPWGNLLCLFGALGIAIVFTASYAVHSTLGYPVAPPWVETWFFGFGPIVRPLLAAACISLVSINDLHRRVARYKEMRVRLEAARKEAAYVQTWGALERVVAKAERALLQEVFEWHSITSFTESN
jgi:hypothetical protein